MFKLVKSLGRGLFYPNFKGFAFAGGLLLGVLGLIGVAATVLTTSLTLPLTLPMMIGVALVAPLVTGFFLGTLRWLAASATEYQYLTYEDEGVAPARHKTLDIAGWIKKHENDLDTDRIVDEFELVDSKQLEGDRKALKAIDDSLVFKPKGLPEGYAGISEEELIRQEKELAAGSSSDEDTDSAELTPGMAKN